MTMKAWAAVVAMAATGLAGCAGGGGGFLGIGAIVGDRNLASAEPLFSKAEQDCAGSADQLIAMVFGTNSDDVWGKTVWVPSPSGTRGKDPRGTRARRPCSRIQANLRWLLMPGSPSDVSRTPYDQRQRNELVDALIATSNRKCTRYTALLKNADGAMNAGLSVGAIVSGGLGSILPGVNTAKALAGTSSILSGSRAALNDVYLSNQTIHVLTAAFEKARRVKRRSITNREACTVEQYPLMRGIEDAFDYHDSCSIVAGLAETALSIERSENPGVDAMRLQLNKMTNLRRQMAELAAEGTITPIAAPPTPISLEKLKAADEALTSAQKKLAEAEATRVTRDGEVTAAKAALAAGPGERVALAADVRKKQDEADKSAKLVERLTLARDEATAARNAQVHALVRVTSNGSAAPTDETRTCPFT